MNSWAAIWQVGGTTSADEVRDQCFLRGCQVPEPGGTLPRSISRSRTCCTVPRAVRVRGHAKDMGIGTHLSRRR